MAKTNIKQTIQTVGYTRITWMTLGLLTLVLRWLFALNPTFTEVVYSRGIFQLIRITYDYTLGWLPIAFLYLAVPTLLFLAGRYIWKNLKKPMSVRQRLGRTVTSLLAFMGAVYFLFHFLWAFNYFRQPLESQMGLAEVPSDTAIVKLEFERATKEMLESRVSILPTIDTSALTIDLLPPNLELHMRNKLEEVMKKYEFPTIGRVRGRIIHPQGGLIQSGASGIYIPFVMEGHLDGALTAPSIPSTLAHEMAHGYGFGDEGSCNFWAYLACEESDIPIVKYSGRFEYWIYVARQYRKLFPQRYKDFRKTLPKGVLNDLKLLRKTYARYPGFFPKTSAYVYDQYLKSQGIKEGSFSYQRVVQLVIAWRKRYEGESPK